MIDLEPIDAAADDALLDFLPPGGAPTPEALRLTLWQWRRQRMRAASDRLFARASEAGAFTWNGIAGAASKVNLTLPSVAAAAPPALFADAATELDPRDPETGERLTTPPHQQPPKDPNCCSYAIAAAMETFRCWRAGSSATVAWMSVSDIVSKAIGDGQSLHKVARAPKVLLGVLDRAVPIQNTWVPTFRQLTKGKSAMPAAMRKALVAGSPLAVSLPIYPKVFMRPEGVEVYAPDSSYGEEDGAHALCVVGYTRHPTAGDCWIAKNSYGPAWGTLGFTLLPVLHDRLDVEVSGVYAIEDVRPGPV